MQQLHDTVPLIVPPPHGSLLKSLQRGRSAGGGSVVAVQSLAIHTTAAEEKTQEQTKLKFSPMAESCGEAPNIDALEETQPSSSSVLH